MVRLTGLIYDADSTWPSVIARLPEGMCPEKRHIFHANQHAGVVRVDVLANCEVHRVGTTSAGGRPGS